jgi:hypothetical protein
VCPTITFQRYGHEYEIKLTEPPAGLERRGICMCAATRSPAVAALMNSVVSSVDQLDNRF